MRPAQTSELDEQIDELGGEVPSYRGARSSAARVSRKVKVADFWISSRFSTGLNTLACGAKKTR